MVYQIFSINQCVQKKGGSQKLSKSVGCSARCTSALAFSEVKGLWSNPAAFYSVKPLHSWDKLNSGLVWLSFHSLTFQVSFLLAFLTYMVKWQFSIYVGQVTQTKSGFLQALEDLNLDFSLRFNALLMLKINIFFS